MTRVRFLSARLMAGLAIVLATVSCVDDEYVRVTNPCSEPLVVILIDHESDSAESGFWLHHRGGVVDSIAETIPPGSTTEVGPVGAAGLRGSLHAFHVDDFRVLEAHLAEYQRGVSLRRDLPDVPDWSIKFDWRDVTDDIDPPVAINDAFCALP